MSRVNADVAALPRTVNAYAALGPKEKLVPYSFEAPPLSPGGVEIKVQYCGLCGSDAHLLAADGGYARRPRGSGGASARVER